MRRRVILGNRSAPHFVFTCCSVPPHHNTMNEDPRITSKVLGFARPQPIESHNSPPDKSGSTGLRRGDPSRLIVPTSTTPGSQSRTRPSSAKRGSSCSKSLHRTRPFSPRRRDSGGHPYRFPRSRRRCPEVLQSPIASTQVAHRSAAASGVHRNASSSACDGDLHPRVCRGLPLSRLRRRRDRLV